MAIKVKKVYIAGPMRGIKHFNFPAFDAASTILRHQGMIVFSPAELDRAAGFDETKFPEDYDWKDLSKVNFSLQDAINRDVKALQSVDAIYMLDGWERSSGARAEKALAEWMGLEVLYQSPPEGEGSTVVNDKGGKQSFVKARFDCIPATALRLLAQCLGFGARKYGKENWKNISEDDNLSHAMNHINEWRRGDREEPHLVNAMARITFALSNAVDAKQQPEEYIHPDELRA